MIIKASDYDSLDQVVATRAMRWVSGEDKDGKLVWVVDEYEHAKEHASQLEFRPTRSRELALWVQDEMLMHRAFEVRKQWLSDVHKWYVRFWRFHPELLNGEAAQPTEALSIVIAILRSYGTVVSSDEVEQRCFALPGILANPTT